MRRRVSKASKAQNKPMKKLRNNRINIRWMDWLIYGKMSQCHMSTWHEMQLSRINGRTDSERWAIWTRSKYYMEESRQWIKCNGLRNNGRDEREMCLKAFEAKIYSIWNNSIFICEWVRARENTYRPHKPKFVFWKSRSIRYKYSKNMRTHVLEYIEARTQPVCFVTIM